LVRIPGLVLSLFLAFASTSAAEPVLDQSFTPISRAAIATVDPDVMWAETFRVGLTGALDDVSLLLLGGRGDLYIDIVSADPFGGPSSFQSLGRVTVHGVDLGSGGPAWFTADFTPLAIEVVAGQTLGILLQTDSAGASFNWYGDYTVYPWAMSWSASIAAPSRAMAESPSDSSHR
jgi:hypothetical protein